MQYKGVPFASVKASVDLEKRTIALHSSVTGNVDLGGDVILPGAFADTLEERREGESWRIPLLWQHDTHVPIGKPIELREDDVGLFSVDEIPDTGPGCPGTRALVLAKSGVVWGASIGYMPEGESYNENGDRVLPKIDLFERSIVTFPMNEEARIVGVGDAKRARSVELLTPELQEKIGRVLRRGNLSKLEEAIGLLLAIMDSAAPPEDEDEDKGSELPESNESSNNGPGEPPSDENEKAEKRVDLSTSEDAKALQESLDGWLAKFGK